MHTQEIGMEGCMGFYCCDIVGSASHVRSVTVPAPSIATGLAAFISHARFSLAPAAPYPSATTSCGERANNKVKTLVRIYAHDRHAVLVRLLHDQVPRRNPAKPALYLLLRAAAVAAALFNGPEIEIVLQRSSVNAEPPREGSWNPGLLRLT